MVRRIHVGAPQVPRGRRRWISGQRILMDEHHIIHTRGSLALLKDLGTWFLKIFKRLTILMKEPAKNGRFSIIGSLTRLFEKTV